MSSVKQMALATMMYNEDFKIGKIPREAGAYPETLYGLVTHGILTKDDYQKLTRKCKITYFRPTLPDGDPSLPILYARGGETTILGFLTGDVASIPDPHRDELYWFVIAGIGLLAILVFVVAWSRGRTELSA
jgi:hypothetical protein